MLPYRKQNENKWQPSARFQSERNDHTNANFSNSSLTDVNLEMNLQPTQRRNYNNRTVACRVNPMASHSMGGSVNYSKQPSTSAAADLNQSSMSSIYQFQPNNSFVSQWHNQQMPFGVMSVSQVGNRVDLGQNRAAHLMNEIDVTEKQFCQNTSTKKGTPSASQKSGFRFASPCTTSSSQKIISKKQTKDVAEDSCHLVGSVEQVLRWYQIAKSNNIFAIFEVHGNLESIRNKDDAVILMIKQGKFGPSIQGVFYSIDRPFMDYLMPGVCIVCTGVMKGAKKMQVFNVWQENGKTEDYNRISFLCQRALQEKILTTPEP